MKIVYQIIITDEDVRHDVERTVEEQVANGWIEFPSGEAREEFIDDCTECICDQYENGFYDREMKYEDYENAVLDLAKDYGYRKE